MKSLPLVPVSLLMTSDDTAGMVELEPESESLSVELVTVTFTVVPELFLEPDKPSKPNAPRELAPPLVNQAKNPPESSSSSSSSLDFFLLFLDVFCAVC